MTIGFSVAAVDAFCLREPDVSDSSTVTVTAIGIGAGSSVDGFGDDTDASAASDCSSFGAASSAAYGATFHPCGSCSNEMLLSTLERVER